MPPRWGGPQGTTSPFLEVGNIFSDTFSFKSASHSQAAGHVDASIGKEPAGWQTWQAMVPAPLQVERCQVQGLLAGQHEQTLRQLLAHQLVLHLQLGRSRQKAPYEGVHTPWKNITGKAMWFSDEFWRGGMAPQIVNYAYSQQILSAGS